MKKPNILQIIHIHNFILCFPKKHTIHCFHRYAKKYLAITIHKIETIRYKNMLKMNENIYDREEKYIYQASNFRRHSLAKTYDSIARFLAIIECVVGQKSVI